MRRVFCGECGSCLYTEVPGAGIISVARGAVDGEVGGLGAPEVEVWCVRKEGWVEFEGVRERFKGNP